VKRREELDDLITCWRGVLTIPGRDRFNFFFELSGWNLLLRKIFFETGGSSAWVAARGQVNLAAALGDFFGRRNARNRPCGVTAHEV
jgi:hypothetical protein